MKRANVSGVLEAKVILPAVALCALPLAGDAVAQEEPTADAPGEAIEEVVVTGSRIRRSVTDTIVPTTMIGEQTFGERGYVSAAQALNDVTSINPQLNQAPGDGSSSGTGRQFPELFGLGTGRTLTLVNGRRFVTSSSGLGDAQVDANIIPTGLIERIEIVQAGAAAVYGSDAIAGVVNYILKDNFEGLVLDAQYGDSWRGDYAQENLRLTWGRNFASGRGNAAFNAEWAATPELMFGDRPRTNLSRITQGNPADTGPDDGIPSVQEILDAHFWNFNENGVIYNIPAPPPMFLTLVGGAPAQFTPGGDIAPYNPGNILGIPFASGGNGFRFSELAGLRTAVDRLTANLIGHYDVSDRMRLNAEFLYAQTEGEERPQGYARTVLSPPPLDAIAFTRNNPFLTQSAIDSLSAASPQFAAGGPLFLSRHFYYDLLPSNVQTTETDTYRWLLGAEGDFDAAGRNWYWSASGSYGRVEGGTHGWDVHNARFANAISAVGDGSGGALCAINADADPSNDDPACAPVNPFGAGNISGAASEYVSVLTGNDYTNEQLDFLATLGTTLFAMPAGEVDAVFAYERRDEEAEFVPLPANQQGVTGTGAMEVPQSGEYHTNEISFEVLVPLLGGDMALPFAETVEFNGTYRYVDNSIAGTEDVWSAGLRWTVVEDLTLRASRSRNFRAPTLTQLVAPTAVVRQAISRDPCDADRITSGPNPAARLANCQAEWAANPAYGPLEDFQDPAENFTITDVTTGGNPDLRNEISDTTIFGFVLQPRFAPGLTASVDWMDIELTDGLSAFTPADFLATCYDSTPQPEEVCNTFTRLAAPDGNSPAGTIVTALSTTFNAGIIEYEGEYYYLNYDLPLANIFGGDPGDLSLSIEATHSRKLNTSVTGTTFVRTDNTAEQPDWVGRFNARYARGPLRLTWQMYYLSEVLAQPDATIENNPNPVLDSNLTHSLSAQYDVGNLTFRAGVDNVLDEEPSYPSFVHGDILGRRWFFGATASWE